MSTDGLALLLRSFKLPTMAGRYPELLAEAEQNHWGDRQFLTVQRRLEENDLRNRWPTPVGSAVFAILPGTGTDPDAWRGQSLLA